MQRMTVREYARRHKLSLFQVIKKINAGELASETVEEKGRSVQYVLLEKAETSLGERSPRAEEAKSPSTQARTNEELLLREITLLRREIELLRAELRKCCSEKAKDD